MMAFHGKAGSAACPELWSPGHPHQETGIYLMSLPLSDTRERNADVQRSGGAAQSSQTWSSEREALWG